MAFTMILAVDIGNTGISVGFYDLRGLTLAADFRLATHPFRTADEYELLISTLSEKRGMNPHEVEGCALSSVVPGLTGVICTAIRQVFGCRILTISHGIRTGLDIRTDHHTEVGSDLVSNMVAASSRLKKPFAVMDLGTATTVSAVNRAGEFIGVMIMPGVSASAEALSRTCAALPSVSLTPPKGLLGKNTADSIASGCIYGPAAMLDGVLAKLKRDLGDDLSVIACGGMAATVVPYMEEPVETVPDLTLEGLVRIWLLNKREKKERN